MLEYEMWSVVEGGRWVYDVLCVGVMECVGGRQCDAWSNGGGDGERQGEGDDDDKKNAC